jgi:hypothetical protein
MESQFRDSIDESKSKALRKGEDMKRTMIGLAFLAMVGFAAAAAADGSGHVHINIVNCTGQRILVCTFNGDDGVTSTEHDSAKPNNGEKRKLSCHGHGKGGCKVKMANNVSSDCGEHKGQLFNGRHKGYFKIVGNDDGDLVEISKDTYDSDDACSGGE